LASRLPSAERATAQNFSFFVKKFTTVAHKRRPQNIEATKNSPWVAPRRLLVCVATFPFPFLSLFPQTPQPSSITQDDSRGPFHHGLHRNEIDNLLLLLLVFKSAIGVL
jgi:hypothetical protein